MIGEGELAVFTDKEYHYWEYVDDKFVESIVRKPLCGNFYILMDKHGNEQTFFYKGHKFKIEFFIRAYDYISLTTALEKNEQNLQTILHTQLMGKKIKITNRDF